MNKKELEKKKDQKRKEKLARKEERKSNVGPKSLDDMIAYVDENGQLTDTPPDPKKKKEIELESINISTPKMEDVEISELRGRVEHFNSDKGYGFIKNLGSIEKYFFHINSAPASISEGNEVIFELERGKKGLNAVNISIVK